MQFLLLLGVGLLAYKFLWPSGAAAGGPGGKVEVALQNFEPKIAAEILRNLVLYTSEPAGTPSDIANGIEHIKLHYEESGFPADSLDDASRAFRNAVQWNTAGLAILGPIGMWMAQPWDASNAQLLGVPATDTGLINSLTAKGQPWAVIVRAPGRLAKYGAANAQSFADNLAASDIA